MAVVLRLVRVTVFILLRDFLILLMAGREKAAWSHAANRDGANLTELGHTLISIILLDHFGIVIWMLDLDVLI